MNTITLIFLGAGLGGVLRYGISTSIYNLFKQNFPYGTLVVNVSGSFLMGFLFILSLERFQSIAPQLRSLLLIGFLGGYTTFSSFSIETINLMEKGDWFIGILNIVFSTVLCLIAAWIGVILGRNL
ncbi:MAG: putative fluoride ion transporter CrcB [Pseudomonadota bacterium]